MQSFQYRVDAIKVFTDMCHLGFIAIYNQMQHSKWQKFENEYIKVINQYEKKEQLSLRQLLETAVAGMKENPFRDILRELYMSLNISKFPKRASLYTMPDISTLC